MHVRNPVEWGFDQVRVAGHAVGAIGRARRAEPHRAAPAVRRIGAAAIGDALARGLRDFAAFRTDVVFLCVVYPAIGLVLARFAFGEDLLPLLFPLASGFALVGPFAAIGLYEMSRRRELGMASGWADAFAVFRSPAIGAILGLGLILVVIFLLWIVAAAVIYDRTLGPASPTSLAAFAHDVLMTDRGWALIAIGIGVGFLFAVLAMAVSVVSFPLLLDCDLSLGAAVATSVRAVARNPGAMALWGLVVAGLLVLGSIPLFVGLIVVLPVLGHSTWHLYRRLIEPGRL